MLHALVASAPSLPQTPQTELAVLLFLLLVLALSLAIFGLLGFRSANLTLQHNEQRQRVVLDCLTDGLVTLDEQRIIRNTNRAVEDMFGWTQEEMLGRHIQLLLPEPNPGDDAGWARLQQPDVPLLRSQVLQATGQHKRGHYFPVHLSLRRIDVHGQPHHVCVISDASQMLAFQNSALTARSELDSFVAALSQHSIFSETDVEGSITQVNAAFCQISGYNEDELLGRKHSIVNSRVQPPEFWQNMWHTVMTGQAWHGEVCNRAKNGELYWVDSLIAPVLDADGGIQRIVSIRHDITARKQYEQQLLTTQHMLEMSNRTASIAAVEYDMVNNRVTVSPNIRDILDIPDHLPLERDILKSFTLQHEPLARAVEEGTLTGQSWDMTFPVQRAQGGQRWIRFVGQAEVVNGQCERRYGLVQDITAIKQREEHLAMETRRLSSLIDSNRIGTWEYNLCTKEWHCNRHWGAMIGLTPEETREMTNGKANAIFDAPYHSDSDTPEQAYFPDPKGVMTFRLRHKHGHWIWVQSHYTVMEQDEAGQPVLVYGANIDVTELVQARLQAESASHSKDQFLSTMSHELRTPMNAILGFSQLLEIDGSLNAEQQDSVQEILKASHHLLDLINDILDLAKINAGRLDLNLEQVNLGDVLSECKTLIAPLANARQLVLHFPHDNHLLVRADRLRLKQVLLNLLSNAVKYNQDGGFIQVTVDVAHPHELQVNVEDSGPGISPDDMPRMFQPFTRLEGVHRDIEGTGIGLSITQRLVELMDGQIGVDSELGRGSTFWVKLPLAQPAGLPH